jgi:hypothetical protein
MCKVTRYSWYTCVVRSDWLKICWLSDYGFESNGRSVSLYGREHLHFKLLSVHNMRVNWFNGVAVRVRILWISNEANISCVLKHHYRNVHGIWRPRGWYVKIVRKFIRIYTCWEFNRESQLLTSYILLQSCKLLNYISRPNFTSISKEQQAQIINHKQSPLYITLNFTCPHKNIFSAHRIDTIHWNVYKQIFAHICDLLCSLLTCILINFDNSLLQYPEIPQFQSFRLTFTSIYGRKWSDLWRLNRPRWNHRLISLCNRSHALDSALTQWICTVQFSVIRTGSLSSLIYAFSARVRFPDVI